MSEDKLQDATGRAMLELAAVAGEYLDETRPDKFRVQEVVKGERYALFVPIRVKGIGVGSYLLSVTAGELLEGIAAYGWQLKSISGAITGLANLSQEELIALMESWHETALSEIAQ